MIENRVGQGDPSYDTVLGLVLLTPLGSHVDIQHNHLKGGVLYESGRSADVLSSLVPVHEPLAHRTADGLVYTAGSGTVLAVVAAVASIEGYP